METIAFLALAAACAPQTDPGTARAVASVESGLNPHAIGVVRAALSHQPRSRPEALATANALRAAGWNFSIGLGQINVRNLDRLSLTMEQAFDPCTNLAAMQRLLGECFERARLQPIPAQSALRQALSCYYSGNFVTGFQDGYVAKVVRAISASAVRPASPLRSTKESP